MLAKKAYFGGSASNFTVAARAGRSEDRLAQSLVKAWGAELKAATGMDLYAAAAADAAGTASLSSADIGAFKLLSSARSWTAATPASSGAVNTTVD